MIAIRSITVIVCVCVWSQGCVIPTCVDPWCLHTYLPTRSMTAQQSHAHCVYPNLNRLLGFPIFLFSRFLYSNDCRQPTFYFMAFTWTPWHEQKTLYTRTMRVCTELNRSRLYSIHRLFLCVFVNLLAIGSPLLDRHTTTTKSIDITLQHLSAVLTQFNHQSIIQFRLIEAFIYLLSFFLLGSFKIDL